VTSRLARAVPQDQEGHPVKWQFSVQEAVGTNARSWPDGRIEVTAGTLIFVHGEAELAAVIAHEMAHVYCRHGWQRSLESWAVVLAGGALGAVLAAQGNDASTALGSASGAILTISLTALTARQRDQEYEADRVSLDLMRRAGYSPEAAVRFWQRYTTARTRLGLGKAHWWKSHPPDTLRVLRLQEAAAPR
jgi:predicted Zn-dependent protease